MENQWRNYDQLWLMEKDIHRILTSHRIAKATGWFSPVMWGGVFSPPTFVFTTIYRSG